MTAIVLPSRSIKRRTHVGFRANTRPPLCVFVCMIIILQTTILLSCSRLVAALQCNFGPEREASTSTYNTFTKGTCHHLYTMQKVNGGYSEVPLFTPQACPDIVQRDDNFPPLGFTVTLISEFTLCGSEQLILEEPAADAKVSKATESTKTFVHLKSNGNPSVEDFYNVIKTIKFRTCSGTPDQVSAMRVYDIIWELQSSVSTVFKGTNKNDEPHYYYPFTAKKTKMG
eukprot:PhM_4_TR15886/c3_g2_i1/m.17038